jgi:hypothetical protein
MKNTRNKKKIHNPKRPWRKKLGMIGSRERNKEDQGKHYPKFAMPKICQAKVAKS